MASLNVGDKIRLDITALGSNGDGIGHYQGKKIFVAKTAPGDEVEAIIQFVSSKEIRAIALSLFNASDQRQEPACPYFSKCGGCGLQHLATDAYRQFKQQIVDHIVMQADQAETAIKPFVSINYGERRRVDFKISVRKDNVSLGFYGLRSHEVVAIDSCMIATDGINALIEPLTQLVSGLAKPTYINTIAVTELESGLDMLVATDKSLKAPDIDMFRAFAKEHETISRLVISTEGSEEFTLLMDRHPVTLTLSDVEVELPVGAFLQATKRGQEAITSFISNHLDAQSVIADIYAGCGTYSFPLAKEGHSIFAYEGSEEMVMAMHNAASHSNIGHRVNAAVRDLVKDPLTAKQLNQFDAVIINPPRQGAYSQVKQLVKSDVLKVLLVSCNPKTLEKDLKLLFAHGYKLKDIQAIDQFYQTHHLEVVVALEKGTN